jgi:hypothetical protein
MPKANNKFERSATQNNSQMSAAEDCCYICLGAHTAEEKLINEPICYCTGSINLHWSCFLEMLQTTRRTRCGICAKQYRVTPGIQSDSQGQQSPVIVFDKTERKIYSPQGSLLFEGTLVGGTIDGIWKQYYDTGSAEARVVEIESTYVNGVANGRQRRFYQSGALQWEQTIVKGQKHGLRKEYDEAGALIREIRYDHGNIQ